MLHNHRDSYLQLRKEKPELDLPYYQCSYTELCIEIDGTEKTVKKCTKDFASKYGIIVQDLITVFDKYLRYLYG